MIRRYAFPQSISRPTTASVAANMKVLVTGASGFVGRTLCRWLAAAGHDVVGTVRTETTQPGWMTLRATGDLTAIEDFAPLTSGMDAIVHLAARVHVMRDAATDPAAVYKRANTDVTARLAAAAAAAGVARLVFMSSVKVSGDATQEAPFDETMAPAPQDAYGRCKLAEEQALDAYAATSMTVVTLRPPLIYGPGVKANFHTLMRLCATPLPLPLDGLTGNRRSLLFVGNLAHAIERILTFPEPASGTFLLSDGEDLSTAELVRRLRLSFIRKTVPLPVPPAALRTLAWIAGRPAATDELCGSLQINSQRFHDAFAWAPRFTVSQGLAATASAFRARR